MDANREQSLNNLMHSNAMASVFLPALGYAKVTEIVRESLKENRPFVDVAIEHGLMTRDEVMRTLSDSTRYTDRP